MSLLMDALRKAEEEKKKAAQARNVVPPPASESVPEIGMDLVLEPLSGPANRERDQLGAALTDDRPAERVRDAPSGVDRVSDRQPGMVQTALQEYFESSPPPRERPRSGRDTWPGGGINESTSSTLERAAVVGARTVFEAGRNPTRNYLFRIALGGVFVLLVVLSGAAYYHYLLTPKINPMPLPAAALTAPPSMPQTTKPMAQPKVAAATPEDAPGRAETSVVPATANPLPRETPRRVDQASTAGATVPERTSAMAGDAEPEVEVAPGLLRISRRGATVTLDTNLLDGYAALQREDWNAADAAYRKALQHNPASRDAMLGLAAVALRSGDAAQARSWYRELLQRDPNDSVALAALFAEDGGGDLDESRLRQLLEQQPGAAHIRFALGRAYARQQRWPDAQQQFFEAFGAAPDNADYAFNLAVSLDHMGQGAAAAGYYQQALDLAAAGPGASFDSAAARARITALGVR